MLEAEHAHFRDRRIAFDEEPHIYYVDGDPSFTSVTTFIHRFFAGFDPDAAIAKMQASAGWPKSPYFGMTAEAIKQQWSDVGKDASTKGTELHRAIEAYYNGEPQPAPEVLERPEWGYFMNFAREFAHLVPYRTEWMIFDEELRIAGSVDMVFRDPEEPGKLMVFDWKRAKEIIWTKWKEHGLEPLDHLADANGHHYSLQLYMYKYILEKNYGVKISKLFLVRMHPNSDNYELVEGMDMTPEIRDLVVVRRQELQEAALAEQRRASEQRTAALAAGEAA